MSVLNQNLFFNLITFDWPSEKPAFFFSKDKHDKYPRLHKSLFPNDIDKIFPGISKNGVDFIYTTFTGKTEGFSQLKIDFKNENPDLLKRYYNQQINYYFGKTKEQIVKTGFIKETQVWLPSPALSTEKYNVFDKFTLRIQLCNVSKFPELLLSYDGISKVLKSNIAELITEVSPQHFNWILYKNHIIKYEDLIKHDVPVYADAYPVLSTGLKKTLQFPFEPPPRDNRYKPYINNINKFYLDFLDNDSFREIIPLHKDGFFKVSPVKIFNTEKDSNKLVFGTKDGNIGFDIVPNNGIKSFGPFKTSQYNKIHLFFIVHKDDAAIAIKLKEYLQEGFKWFGGLQKYVNLLFHTEEGFSIVFKDKDNPVSEIEEKLTKRDINSDIKYIAIYITPFTKYEEDKQKREIYYKIKELLLKRGITSQAIVANKVLEQKDNYVYSLPNIAVAILAKLDGIPWRLNTPVKNELIVGVGAFKHIETDIQYIGSAFSFNNTGHFNRFEYFMQHEINILAGSISRAIREYATVHHQPERLIIHFYKTMSEKELLPIENALRALDLNIPIFIVTVNKTESEDIIVFDKNWNDFMPVSGTYVNIGSNKYLLCNNTRYPDGSFSKNDGFPFPIKLKIDCNDKAQLQEIRIIKELINQVYQFSRMYWKSVRQQNLPITIKYPEMVAQIAPHFDGVEIPDFGKDNLWFL